MSQDKKPLTYANLPKVMWHEPSTHVILKAFEEAARRMSIFTTPPTNEEEFLDKGAMDKIERLVAIKEFSKIRFGGMALGNFRAESYLENELSFMQNYNPKLPFFSWLVKWTDEFDSNNNLKAEEFDFDKSFFPRAAEESQSPEAIKFKTNRGFIWEWREREPV